LNAERFDLYLFEEYMFEYMTFLSFLKMYVGMH